MRTARTGPDAGATAPGSRAGRLPRNDPRQYDDLADEWWQPDGAFAMLHWLAEARAALVPPATRPGALLVDLGCGAGLLAPRVAGRGYRHVGVDLVRSALAQAAAHGVTPVNGDVGAVPLADGCADVVAAGEVLEHVPDWRRVVAEAARLLRPGGTLVLDTLNATALSRLLAVRVAELFPGVPRGIHDPRLFVDARELVDECARHGIALRVRGIRPAVWGTARWLLRRAVRRAAPPGSGRTGAPDAPRIVPTWSAAVLYQGWGTRQG
ncbi:bifunctional 3-demethylubiquinone 3-O-methyltransferase/2-octaprenyl-6-hydroxy phenol methylase [Plantactinospora sp. BC1]|uniref:methyltransferase domain-containing protein n=1 Tax=Plantactinospora sp. BC1 TaxID=2108470 RepID=UPI000D177DAE|nr:methyltransferase domain-containing protein [Plantactinospora sp. BC1]AVT29822.1 bifunctional 3-demethylubiquinone 3-O-methyltransferase/2-octaprenyl-6-hydroxy phenol methylase [Plantactinospora sp. BC1]